MINYREPGEVKFWVDWKSGSCPSFLKLFCCMSSFDDFERLTWVQMRRFVYINVTKWTKFIMTFDFDFDCWFFLATFKCICPFVDIHPYVYYFPKSSSRQVCGSRYHRAFAEAPYLPSSIRRHRDWSSWLSVSSWHMISFTLPFSASARKISTYFIIFWFYHQHIVESQNRH